MNKSKFLTVIILGLLISNAILFFMFLKGPKLQREPKNVIINKLHLDEDQVKNYEVFIQKHRKAVKDNEETMSKLRNDLYQNLKYDQKNIKIDSFLTKIAKQQYIAEEINYQHFLEIKDLCKPSQQKDFDELINEIPDLFSRKRRK